MRQAHPSVFALVFLCSCSAPSAFDGELYESLRRDRPHPYSVQVVVEQEPEGSFGQGSVRTAIVDTSRHAEIRQSIVEALRKYRTFSLVYTDADSERTPDLRLVVKLRAPADIELSSTRNNYKWASSILWLFAGFPGWLIEDLEFNTGVEAGYRLVRNFGNSTKDVNSGALDLKEAQKLNFIRRAGLSQYAQQLFIPPPWVSSDRDKANESLYENYVARIQKRLGERVKADLNSMQLAPDGPFSSFLYVSERPEGDGRHPVFVFARMPVETMDIETDAGPDLLPFENLLIHGDSVRLLEERLDEEPLAAAKSVFPYQYVCRLSAAELDWTTAPTRLQVKFLGENGRVWSWTPRREPLEVALE